MQPVNMSHFCTSKRAARRIVKIYEDLHRLEQADKIRYCGNHLEFDRYADGSNRLVYGNFCKDRMCPMCQWRRSLKFAGQLKQIADYFPSTDRYLLITLTVVNPDRDHFLEVLNRMQKRSGDMLNDTRYRKVVIGYCKSLEITYNVTAHTFHPHYHILAHVPDSYYQLSDKLLNAEWLQLWRTYYGDPNITQVNVSKVKPKNDSIAKACCETAKYSLSLQDDELQDIPLEDFEFLEKSLHNRLLVVFGRDFRKARTALKLQSLETTSLSDDQSDLNEDLVRFREVYIFIPSLHTYQLKYFLDLTSNKLFDDEESLRCYLRSKTG